MTRLYKYPFTKDWYKKMGAIEKMFKEKLKHDKQKQKAKNNERI